MSHVSASTSSWVASSTPVCNTSGTIPTMKWQTNQYPGPLGYITNVPYGVMATPFHLNTLTSNTLNLQFKNARSRLCSSILEIKNQAHNVTYPLRYSSFKVFIENELTDSQLPLLEISAIEKKNLRYTVLALDLNNNRLELVSVFPESDARANLALLIDDAFSVYDDKTEYLNSLYSRHTPYVLQSVASITKTGTTTDIILQRDLNSGLIPVLHLSNIIFGGLIPPTKQDVGQLFENLTTEVIVFNKQDFPAIQTYFSPEYGYLSLDNNKNLKQIIRNHTLYTDLGFIELLKAITIPNTNVVPFATCLLGQMTLDQSIKDIPGMAISSIKQFIEELY